MEIQLTIGYFNDFVNAQSDALRSIKKLAVLDRDLVENLFHVSSIDATIILQLDMNIILSIAKKNSNLFTVRIPDNSAELDASLSNPDMSALEYSSYDVKEAVLSYKEAQLNALIALKCLTNISVTIASLLTSASIKDCQKIAELPLNKIISIAQRYPWLFLLNYSARSDIFTSTAEVRRHTRPFVESTVNY
jgi:hypothetical protein